MKRIFAGGLVVASAVLLAACNSSWNEPNQPPAVTPPPPPPPPPPAAALLQVIHASADAPAVNVLVDGEVPEGLDGVPFAAASPYLSLPPGEISAPSTRLLPDGSEVEVLAAPALALESDVAYTVIAAGSTATLLGGGNGTELQLFVLTRPVEATIDGVPRAGAAWLAVRARGRRLRDAPGAALEGAATFAFGEVLDLGTVPAAEYQIRVTPAGSDTVVFDSGPVALPDGADLSIIAVDNTGPGASPIALLAVLADGTVLELRDGGDDASAGLTAVHNAVDAPAVCVVADDATTAEVERVELFAGVPFRGFGYLGEVPPGSYLVGLEVFDAGTGCAGTSVVTFAEAVDLRAGRRGHRNRGGSLATSLELLPLADDLRPIATEARVRIVHGSEATPAVDIYVVAPGTPTSPTRP
jgi:hypothetical protein